MASASRLQWKPKEANDGNRRQNDHRKDFEPSNGDVASKQRTFEQAKSDPKAKLIFVPYLPQDEEGGDASDAQQVADLSNTLLSTLLKMKARDFWSEVSCNVSFRRFVDSYLRFRRRWYDVPASTSDERVIVGDEQLSRRMFMVLLRLSSNQDPGGDGISAQEHAAILLEKGIFSGAKLMDICALYAQDNGELTSKLVSNVFKLQSSYKHEIMDAVPQVINTIRTFHDRCCRTVEDIGQSNELANSLVKAELMEVFRFVYDTFATLDALVGAYARAASFLLPFCNVRTEDNLFSSLGSVHDSLLPVLKKGFTAVGGPPEIGTYMKRLRLLLVEFSWQLLSKGYIGEVMDPKLKGQLLVQAIVALEAGVATKTRGLLQNIVTDYDLVGVLQGLLDSGSAGLADSQYALVLGMLPDTRPATIKETLPNAEKIDQEAAAVLQSQIAQVKDLFPDYGDGFVSACLDAYDNNPEVVIQHILEGTLHPELALLDVSLETKPAKNMPTSTSAKDKGKGKAVLEQVAKKPSSSSSTENSRPAQGRFFRRNQTPDEDLSKLLNARDDALSSQTARLAMLYDDEYDDSFDDLDMSVGDAGLETDSLVDLVSRKKHPESAASSIRGEHEGSLQTSAPRKSTATKAKPYFLKAGKVYNYKVAGSVQVSSTEEAEALRKHEEGLIHGLGRGGNVPEVGLHGWRQNTKEDDENNDDKGGAGPPSGSRKFRRDRAMRKHMAGLRGY